MATPCLLSKNLTTQSLPIQNSKAPSLEKAIELSWQKIAPSWPLKNLVAINPLNGFEKLPFEEAIKQGAAYFQQVDLPQPMGDVNRETIKWCQAFFDEGQATISMPLRHLGFYPAWRKLAYWDKQLHQGDAQKRAWLQSLPLTAHGSIFLCLQKLEVNPQEWTNFLTIMLTTLPGWAAYIKYKLAWSVHESKAVYFPITTADYLAIRLVILCLLEGEGNKLLNWQKRTALTKQSNKLKIETIKQLEKDYCQKLLQQLSFSQQDNLAKQSKPNAQFIFCIDVRSEPFRRALESQGHYETLGCAGFFGLPIQIENHITGHFYSACPVLVSPQHTVKEIPNCNGLKQLIPIADYNILIRLKGLYQSLKYNMTTPFALVEACGFLSGIWMALKCFLPRFSAFIKKYILNLIHSNQNNVLKVDTIPQVDQIHYAETALRMIGLTRHFAKWVVLCGHTSHTLNNAYASALDCGACGGHPGTRNAKILAHILNQKLIREALLKKGISIPLDTYFIAAQHCTTSDEVTLYPVQEIEQSQLQQMKQDLLAARNLNSETRCHKLELKKNLKKAYAASYVRKKSIDWAEVRPEWGLARNAAFIIASRTLTKGINLEGRVFLHSYDWQQDNEGTILQAILTAPMVVAHWISSQYFFSTLDNVAYGSGSKITQNITGKMGIMQGNASDLMHGLPLQSVYYNDQQPYHQPLRLLTIVNSPISRIDNIIKTNVNLKTLFENEWVKLICLEPSDQQFYVLDRHLSWKKAD